MWKFCEKKQTKKNPSPLSIQVAKHFKEKKNSKGQFFKKHKEKNPFHGGEE